MWWFERIADIAPNHVVAVDDSRIPAAVRGSAMVVRRLAIVQVECVGRGYLAGTGTKDYQAPVGSAASSCRRGSSRARNCPSRYSRRPPSRRSARTMRTSVSRWSRPRSGRRPPRSSAADSCGYGRGVEIAARRGIILADTKFEFGYDDAGTLTIGDEVFTPDSSRFWPADQWQPAVRNRPTTSNSSATGWSENLAGTVPRRAGAAGRRGGGDQAALHRRVRADYRPEVRRLDELTVGIGC